MDLTALFKLSYGLYIITSKKENKLNGQIANTAFQVTAEPPQIAISINKENLTHEYIKKSKVFAVSILSVDAPMELIGKFGFKSGRDIDKFEGINFKIGKTGSPIVLDNTIAFVEAKVVKELDVGTHTIFIGEIVNADNLASGEPMTYAIYHLVKKGKSPKKAPVYIPEEKEEKSMIEEKKEKYVCTVCGYIYDPEKGDPANGIDPGTPFEEIPDDWVCPICGAPKEAFEKA